MTSEPRYSIVVPTRARLPQLRGCLQSLAALRFPRAQFEVIVVNDGSPTLPAEELDAFRDRIDIVSIDQPWGGPATARNTGLAAARGTYVAFTDDDCTVSADWLAALDSAFASHPDALVGGRAVNALYDNSCASASQLLVDYLYEYYHHSGTGRGPRFFTSNNMSARRDLLQRIGAWDTTFELAAGEDRDLCDRWTAAGFTLHYCPEARVEHRHALSFTTFTRQHLNYGRGAWTFHAARARRNSKPVRIEPLLFYSGLVMYPLLKRAGLRAPVLVALLAWSQVVNAAGFFAQRWKRR